MKREDAPLGEERTIKTTAQNGEVARFGEETQHRTTAQTARNGENERRFVAPGRFRVVSASGAFSIDVGNAPVAPEQSLKTANREESVDQKEETDSASEVDSNDLNGELAASDGEFDDENAFFASFSTDSESRRAVDAFDDAFAGGLRSLFDAEAEESGSGEVADEDDESEAERFRRDLEQERRESLDGVLLQNDADFLREAGEKFERSRVADSDFERKSASRGQNGQDGRDKQNYRSGERSENSDGGEKSVEATGGRRAPIGPASILEAMLFVGDRENRPLTLARATELMRNVSETEAIEALADLNERYWRDGAPYGSFATATDFGWRCDPSSTRWRLVSSAGRRRNLS